MFPFPRRTAMQCTQLNRHHPWSGTMAWHKKLKMRKPPTVQRCVNRTNFSSFMAWYLIRVANTQPSSNYNATLASPSPTYHSRLHLLPLGSTAAAVKHVRWGDFRPHSLTIFHTFFSLIFLRFAYLFPHCRRRAQNYLVTFT